ncbi:MAG: uracil-DNA glycosylase [Trueperaceae bacterium]
MTLQELEQLTLSNPKPEGLEDLSPNLVFGEGNPDAQLMIIGEAPGEDEDLSGRPFVGRAGQLLDKIFESVSMNRDDVYITNIVKYRPPNNRNPTPQETQVSEPLLLEQIKLIRPQVIATLGNVPTQYFLNTKDGITKTHGKWAEWQSVKVFPLYHPAYLLRNPSRERGSPKWQMWEDMKELKKVLGELGPKPTGKLVIDKTEQSGLF